MTDACYGGTVTSDPGATACAQPNRYLFWDNQDPTTAFHTVFGAELLLTAARAPGRRVTGADPDLVAPGRSR